MANIANGTSATAKTTVSDEDLNREAKKSNTTPSYSVGHLSYPEDLLNVPDYGGNYVMFFINENLAAWSSLEVFIVAIFATLMQVGQFAQFMAPTPKEVQILMATYGVEFGIVESTDATFFGVNAT